MLNLMARTEIQDAWANVVLAGALFAQGKYNAAGEAVCDAERHIRDARSSLTIGQSDSILEEFAELRVKLNEIRSAIRDKSGILVQHAHSGQ